MPYIKPENRPRFEVSLKEIPNNAGELNYLITKICHEYVRKNSECYQTYNDIIGALEGAKLELYRRQVSNYEDVKISENGDT